MIGIVHPLTVALCATTLVLAFASTASLVTAVRWSIRPDRPPLLGRVFPTACGIAFFALSVWLAANGVIGLRTWAW